MEELFSDDYFMRKALDEARTAGEKGEIPVGAVIVSNDRIIGRGQNMTELLNDVTAHAEMLAITSAAQFLGGKFLDGCTLYVTLEPCVMCAGAIYWSRMGKVIIGARDDKRGYTCSHINLHPKTEVVFGVLENECSELLKDFFKDKR